MSKLALSLELQKKAAFRHNHIILPIIDALAALYVSFTQWRARRRTLKALAELDEHQLRDIGLTRGDTTQWWQLSLQAQEKCRRALTALDDGDLIRLSDFGRRTPRQARHGGPMLARELNS
jgi:uncharacterized protein YjiS (DUF1127 family)